MLNIVNLQGRLAAEPELRQTQSGKSVASFRLACNRDYKNQNGETPVDWLTCIAWGNTADFIKKYFHKGDSLLLTGSIQTRNYQDKSGNNRTATEINAERVFFCGGKQTQGNAQTPPRAHTDPNAPIAQTFSPGGFEPIADDEDLPF